MIAVTPSSPFWARFYAYLQERFPLGNHTLLIVSYCSSNQFLAQILESPGSPVHYSLRSAMAAVTVFCFFLHLRVFDEHKDYAEDCIHYPNRVLQSGLIRLKHLKIVGAIAICIELAMGFLAGPAALVSILVVLAFSILMLKEFFVSKWLNQHFILYATSHMLIMPLMAMAIYSIVTQRFLWQASPWFWLYAFVGFFVTFNWEVARKIRAPHDEIDGVNTYTKIFGTFGAAYIVLLIRVIDTGLVVAVGHHIGLSPWFYAVLVALFGVCLIGFFQFRFNTNTKTAKRMETYAGMYIVAFDITLAIEIARAYGLGG